MSRLSKLLFLLILWPALAVGQSTDFDGAASKIDVTSQAAIQTESFSVGCWVRREGDGEGGLGGMLDKMQASTGEGWKIRQTTGDLYRFEAESLAGGLGVWTFAEPADNTWQHYALTYNGASQANNPVVYRNATSITVTTVQPFSTGAHSPGAEILTIGNRSSQANTFDGQLARCFYYNRILTETEVNAIMHRGPSSVPFGLIGHWPLGQWSGLNFSSTASLDGTATTTALDTTNVPPISRPPQGWLWD